MKEFVEKLIKRLEEKADFFGTPSMGSLQKFGYCMGIEDAILIVNQIAEEYKQDITFQYVQLQTDILKRMGIDISCKWETATQQTHALNEAYMRGMQYERDKFTRWQDEQKGGWIPCSERLPEKRDWYLAVFQEVDTGFTGLPFIADYLMGSHTNFTTEDGWIIANCTDIEEDRAEYYKKLKCIAWQPLPAPYIPKQEEQKG